MAEKTKPCTLASRHRWTFIHNRVCQSISGNSVHISKRGVYSCACGAKKLGAPQWKEGDA